jgi:hemolysin activation/secretion protein
VALRGLVYLSGGERPTRVAIGGTWGLRGYPRFSYITGSRALMLNAEWRFPVTDYLSLGFPFGEWRIPGVQGAVFADAGRAWTPRSAYRAVIGSYGIGLRMSVAFPLVLRFDAGWRYGRGSAYGVPLDYRRKRFADLWFGFNY